MTDNATPKPKRAYNRPTKYPAAIPRTMTTEAQRAEVERFAEGRGYTLGEAIRHLIDTGLDNSVMLVKPARRE